MLHFLSSGFLGEQPKHSFCHAWKRFVCSAAMATRARLIYEDFHSGRQLSTDISWLIIDRANSGKWKKERERNCRYSMIDTFMISDFVRKKQVVVS